MTGKNKTRLVGWHPSDPAAVDWLDAEIARRGGGRGAQSAILDDALGKAMDTQLTDDGRFLIAEARRIAPTLRAVILSLAADDRERLAAELLDRLADLAERLGG